MPELPEVETVVRDLRPAVVGRRVTGVAGSDRRLRRAWDPKWTPQLVGRTVAGVRRRGKWILVDLDGQPGAVRLPSPGSAGEGLGVRGFETPPGLKPKPRAADPHPHPLSRRAGRGGPEPPAVLLVHLGMTGQLTTAPAADPVADHTHVRFALDDGSELRFRDVRRFGSADLFPDAADAETFLNARLGPEPFGLDADYFRAAVMKSARPLKAILLDQTVVAGVGNIYADEACFRSRLHPGRRGTTLTPADADRLRIAVEAVLTAAVAGRGSTIRDYVGGSGLAGEFQNEHAAYGRTGRPCVSCATAIEMVRLAGRSSHYCPACQPLAPARRGRTA